MPRPTQALPPLPPPADDLLHRLPLSDRCEHYLRALLLEGGLEPNQPLSVEAVASALNVSRQPAMEAVKRLAADGFVTIQPQVGCRVVLPQPDHVADFYRLFAPAEALIARFAAERRSMPEAQAFQDLSRQVEAEASQAGPPDRRSPAYRALNRSRYEALHAMARSPIAAGLVAGMWDRSDFYIRAAFGSLYFTSAVRRAHVAITEAISAGDPDAAGTATADYLTEVGARTVDRLRRDNQSEGEPPDDRIDPPTASRLCR
jgi:DNA-binding GntR family transcriptional regulator